MVQILESAFEWANDAYLKIYGCTTWWAFRCSLSRKAHRRLSVREVVDTDSQVQDKLLTSQLVGFSQQDITE